MTTATPGEQASRFLDHLDAVFALEPKFVAFESLMPGLPKVTCMVYRDVPEKGWTTGVTYGLSLGDHPSWTVGRPELTITVESPDEVWPLAVAQMANKLRGRCPFTYGERINFGEPVSEDSDMSAFFVFAPSILPPEVSRDIDVGARLPLNISGVYPIHAAEMATIEKIGLKAFWHHPDYDQFSVTRRPILA